MYQIKRYADLMNMFLERIGETCLATKFDDYVGLLKKRDEMSATETSKKLNQVVKLICRLSNHTLSFTSFDSNSSVYRWRIYWDSLFSENRRNA